MTKPHYKEYSRIVEKKCAVGGIQAEVIRVDGISFCKNVKNGTGPVLKKSEFLSVDYPYFRYSAESNCQFDYMCSENEDVVIDVDLKLYRCVCQERFYRSGHNCVESPSGTFSPFFSNRLHTCPRYS